MPLLNQELIRKISGGPNIDAIADVVKRGQCILFLGSGVHAAPEAGSGFDYPENERPPLGSAFSESLAGKCNFAVHFDKESARNLQRVSMCYEIVHGRQELVKEVRQAVHVGRKPSRVLHALARLPFPLVITTNYDQLFEQTLHATGKNPVRGVYNKESGAGPDEPPAQPTVDNPFVFKLHGDIDKPESIVITDEDYIQFVMRMSDKKHPVPMTFHYHFTFWPTLFVGYSLLDYNLRLLFKTLRQVDKARFQPLYSVDPYPDPMIYDVWCSQQKYLSFVVQDAWTFVPALYQKVTGNPMP